LPMPMWRFLRVFSAWSAQIWEPLV
jgi:hypothetical protein